MPEFGFVPGVDAAYLEATTDKFNKTLIYEFYKTYPGTNQANTWFNFDISDAPKARTVIDGIEYIYVHDEILGSWVLKSKKARTQEEKKAVVEPHSQPERIWLDIQPKDIEDLARLRFYLGVILDQLDPTGEFTPTFANPERNFGTSEPTATYFKE